MLYTWNWYNIAKSTIIQLKKFNHSKQIFYRDLVSFGDEKILGVFSQRLPS